jgi:hypothetical protein
MSDSLSGDPFHEGGSQPMSGLKGGMEGPHTQAPMPSENSGDSNGNTVTPGVAGWDETSLHGQHPTNGSNDKNKAH